MAHDTSIETGRVREFSVADYVVFGVSLGFFGVVGIYHAVRDRLNKKETTEEFVLGGRSMSVFPVALSLTVTFLSALSILGNPAEMYVTNTMFMWLAVSAALAMALAGHIFVPFFYKLGVTSTFQYLEWRFDFTVRALGSFFLTVQMLVYMGFVLYAPCLAFSAVSGINLYACIVVVGAVVIFYTSLGGMKAVLWTDAAQFFVILAGILAVLIQGSIETGGFYKAWELADEEHRIYLDNFKVDPTTRHSVWSIVVGGGFYWLALYGVNQAQVQRCLATSSARNAQLAVFLNTPGLLLIILLSCFCGIFMFAFYAKCDPVKSNVIDRSDQLLIVFVMDILGHVEGIPGIFVSCVFSGSLSSISSALNAISTTTYADFLRPFLCKGVSEFTATVINKLLVLIYGSLAIGLAFLASEMGTVLQASVTVFSVLNGPLFGIFVMGMFTPWCNKWGAIVGSLTSLGMIGWIGIGYFDREISTRTVAPVTTEGCKFLNQTTSTVASVLNATTVAARSKEYTGLDKLYTYSYLYYTPAGMTLALVVGNLVSFITGPNKPQDLDPRLICPLFDKLFPCLPEALLRPLRCGIKQKGKYDLSTEPSEIEEKASKPPTNGNKNGATNLAFISEGNTKL